MNEPTTALSWRRVAGAALVGALAGAGTAWAARQRAASASSNHASDERVAQLLAQRAAHAAQAARLDHDLRTPVGTVAAALELLRTEPQGSTASLEALKVIERQVARLHSLTQALRDFSRELSG